MSKKVKAVLGSLVFILVVVFMVGVSFGTIVGYNYWTQKTDEEKRAELMSLLRPQDLLTILSDGKYDKDYNLVDLAGSDLADLTGRLRPVEIHVLDQNGKVIGSQFTLGFIYSQDYVIVPVQLFYFQTFWGQMSIFNLTDIPPKIYLLPDQGTEDKWRIEELGAIKFMSEETSGFAIVERVDPIVGDVDAPQYTFGKYEDLAMGHALYWVMQSNGRLIVNNTNVSELYINEEERNLIGFRGLSFFQDFGGLIFAIRDGKPELVGMVCMTEPILGESGWAYIYALDINQIIAEIEKIEKK